MIKRLERVPDPAPETTMEQRMDDWLNYGERDIDPYFGIDKNDKKGIEKREDEIDDK